ncbi:MAG: IS30 family transposase [bacterium]|nr:IS30 family transposase [bacterium]
MSYAHFTRDDRVRLAVLLKTGMNRVEIGGILKKNPTSIWREINRGNKNGRYLPSVSKKEARERKTHREKKIENNEWLKKYIVTHLKMYWSPEQIAGRLRRENTTICHETIYGYIIRHKKLKKYLRCQKGKYRRRHGTVPREKAREYGKKRWIGERPEVINKRGRIGDWEGDTIIGGERTKRILTHVERVTCYLLADILPVVSAEIVAQKTIESLKKIPKSKRKSITYDNGTEFSAHETIEKKTKATVYFANKYHSWERGTNENTNGLIRQFFPKKSLFAKVTQRDVDRVTKLLNRRPRKKLCYLTPYEMFHCTSF